MATTKTAFHRAVNGVVVTAWAFIHMHHPRLTSAGCSAVSPPAPDYSPASSRMPAFPVPGLTGNEVAQQIDVEEEAWVDKDTPVSTTQEPVFLCGGGGAPKEA